MVAQVGKGHKAGASLAIDLQPVVPAAHNGASPLVSIEGMCPHTRHLLAKALVMVSVLPLQPLNTSQEG
jgi:hypothetical protein